MQRKENVGIIIWRLIYPVLIFFGVEFVIEFSFMFTEMVRLIYSGQYSSANTDELISVLETYLYSMGNYVSLIRTVILVPVYVVFMKKDVKRDEYYGRPTAYSPYSKKWLLLLPVAGVGAALGFNHLVPLLLEALQSLIHTVGKSVFGLDWNVDFFAKFNEVSEGLYFGNVWVQALSIVVAAPLLEELLYRGFIFKRLRAYLKPVPCMLISAFVFGIMHGNAVQFVYAFILGIFMAYVYEKFKTIWASVIFHASANLIAFIVTLVVPEDGLHITMGTYMLLVVVELAVVFLALKLIDMKVDRQPVIRQPDESQ